MVYHKKIGFPKTMKLPNGDLLNLKYSKHAIERKEEYGLEEVPKFVHLKPNYIIEIASRDNIHIRTCLIRLQYNKSKDILLAIRPYFKKQKAKVITLWTNHKKDHHLKNKKQYDKPWNI